MINLVAKTKNGKIYPVVMLTDKVTFQISKQMFRTERIGEGATIHLSTNMTDKNGRLILVGDKVRTPNPDYPIGKIWSDSNDFYMIIKKGYWTVRMLTPEIAATLEVVE